MVDEARPRPFHERFDIEVGIDAAKRHFVNRVNNSIFDTLLYGSRPLPLALDSIHRYVANNLGLRYDRFMTLERYVGGDYFRCLYVLEALYQMLEGSQAADRLSQNIRQIVDFSEVDLGIDWQPPVFVRTGARLLDERLVNEPLRWLSDPQYQTVLEPFQRGLSHYLEDRLSDAVTDMYESVEALARIVTGKDRDLSGNRESFIKSVQASDYYRRLLKDYVEYGSEFRHAVRLSRPRPPLSEPEVESFIYLTGLFIRLAIRTT